MFVCLLSSLDISSQIGWLLLQSFAFGQFVDVNRPSSRRFVQALFGSSC